MPADVKGVRTRIRRSNRDWQRSRPAAGLGTVRARPGLSISLTCGARNLGRPRPEAWIRTGSSSSRACTSCSAPCIHAKHRGTAQTAARGRSLVRSLRSAPSSRVMRTSGGDPAQR
jgi:hypothetical protein